MKFSFIAVFAFCSLSCFSQETETTGTWKGFYIEDGMKKSITISFNDDHQTCVVDMPDRGVVNATCQINVCEAGDLHITRTGPGNAFTFVGKPNGNSLTGNYKMGESCSPGKMKEFKVERVALPQS